MADKDNTPSPKAAWTEDEVAAFNEAVFTIIRTTDEGITANLTGVTFPGHIDFTPIRTFPQIWFQNTTFFKSAEFTNITFSGFADFSNATFCGLAYFRDAIFKGNVNFNDAIFRNMAVFKNGEFGDLDLNVFAYFRRTVFCGETDFSEVKFWVTALFDHAEFSGNADFSGRVEFKGGADFSEAAFSEYANFSEATFSKYANFSGGEGENHSHFSFCRFEKAQFLGAANFSDRTFNNRTRFGGVLFKLAPEFHNSKLHQDTTFPEAENFLDTHSEDATAAYRTLKLAMSDVHAYREQQMFYALEQESNRRQMKLWSFDWLLSALYAVTSNYGQKAPWAIGWLAAFNSWCAGFYKIWDELPPETNSLRFAVQQLVRPFAIWGKMPACDSPYHGLCSPSPLPSPSCLWP